MWGFLVLITCGLASAQDNEVIKARNALVANDFPEATKLIESAITNEKLANDYQTWYWRGMIYKEIYKATEKGKIHQSTNRNISIESFKRALKDKSKVNQDTVNLINKSLKYLSSTLYNDAVLELDTVHYKSAVENFNRYLELSKFIHPDVDLSAQSIQYKMRLAQIYSDKFSQNAGTEAGDDFFNKAKEVYLSVLDEDSNHLSANYNLGIMYYNKAVHIIQSMEYDIDLEALAEKEEVCIEIFLESLPYMLKSYSLDPRRKETLISLTGIYYSLNEMEKYERYKKELEDLR